jgi:mono/diheme cytochrome c family protein
MKSYIPHISKFISLALILLILSFGMIVYAYYDFSKPIPNEPQFYCGVVDLKSEILIDTPEKALGEQIFKNNCSTCHAATDEVVVGPGLKGMEKRRNTKWIVRFVNNPQGMIASGDKYANALYKKYNKMQMTAYPGIKEKDIKAIIAYIDNK